MTESRFLGLPDDMARLCVLRLLDSDSKRRAHNRAALRWQRASTTLAVAASVAASLAAISIVRDIKWTAVALAIAVAIIVPIENTLNGSRRSAEHREASGKYETLANDYEKFMQLGLGPPMWRGIAGDGDALLAAFDALDAALAMVEAQVPRATPKDRDASAAEARTSHVIEYLQMPNVVLPTRSVWR